MFNGWKHQKLSEAFISRPQNMKRSRSNIVATENFCGPTFPEPKIQRKQYRNCYNKFLSISILNISVQRYRNNNNCDILDKIIPQVDLPFADCNALFFFF